MGKKILTIPLGMLAVLVAFSIVPFTPSTVSVSVTDLGTLDDSVVAPVVPADALSDYHTSLGYGSDVDVWIKRFELDWEKWDSNSNVITNDGLNLVRGYLGAGAAGGAINYMALGNTTVPSDTDTEHDGEIVGCGLTNKTADTYYEESQDGNWTQSATWTATCTITVNTTGLYNGTAGTYFAGTNFAAVTLNNNDQITVNYTTWVA